MVLNLEDVTGKDPLVPECKKHKGTALLEESRTVRQGKRIYWRCPIDNKVYTLNDSIVPQL